MGQKPKLIYIGDPMCSWCYGFAEEFTTARATLGDKVDFELIMGGLRPYNTESMKDIKKFLKGHWKHVNEASGQPFSYGILEADTIPYDTEPPCRAVVAMRKLNPDKEFEFFKSIQTAFYSDNKNLNLTETYTELVKQFGVDSAAFVSLYESDELKQAVREDFARSAEMGVRGFPTVILQIEVSNIILSNGYTKAEPLLTIAKQHLN